MFDILGEFERRVASASLQIGRTPNWSRRGFLGRLVTGVLVAITPMAARAQAGTDQSQDASIEGIVIVNGKPLGGVNVNLGRGRSVVTAVEDGSFKVDGLRAGEVMLRFQHPDFVRRALRYTLAGGERVRHTVSLVRKGVISGSIVEKTGAPVVNIAVTPMFHRVTSDGRVELAAAPTAVTNDRGDYRLFDLAPGQYYVNIGRANFGGPMPTPGRPDFEMRYGHPAFLVPGVTQIKDADLVEVKGGEEVRLKTSVLPAIGLGALHANLINPTAGDLDVSVGIQDQLLNVSGGSISSFAGPAQVLGGSRPPLRLQPGEEKVVTFWPNHPGNYEILVSWSGENGVINLRTPVNVSGAEQTVPILLRNPAGRIDFEVWLDEPNKIASPVAGVTLDLGSVPPLASASSLQPLGNITLFSGDRWPGLIRVTGTNGTATFEGIPGGRYHLSDYQLPGASNPLSTAFISSATQSDRPILSDGFEVSLNSEPVRIRIRPGSVLVKGRILDSAGIGLHDAFVTLIPTSPTRLIKASPSGRTDQNGSFQFQVAPGEYTLYCWTTVEFPTGDYLSNRHLDSQFLRKYQVRGLSVSVTEGTREMFLTQTIGDA
jgi:hypothetical protein